MAKVNKKKQNKKTIWVKANTKMRAIRCLANKYTIQMEWIEKSAHNRKINIF